MCPTSRTKTCRRIQGRPWIPSACPGSRTSSCTQGTSPCPNPRPTRLSTALQTPRTQEQGTPPQPSPCASPRPLFEQCALLTAPPAKYTGIKHGYCQALYGGGGSPGAAGPIGSGASPLHAVQRQTGEGLPTHPRPHAPPRPECPGMQVRNVTTIYKTVAGARGALRWVAHGKP
jgi:hypothetical protein